jgi:ribosomal protein S27AE
VAMAIVLPTRLDVDGYVAAGREVEMPRPACPRCGDLMQFWGMSAICGSAPW